MRVGALAVRAPPAAVRDPTDLLDVDVHQVPGDRVFVAARLLAHLLTR